MLLTLGTAAEDAMTAVAPFYVRAGDERPVNLLLVSPNPRLRVQLSEKIGAPRWNVVEAGSGAEALERLTEERMEVLLLDPMLPDIVANEFSALVLQRFPSIEILTLNAQTGHLLLANASPTALATQLTDLIYRSSAPEPAW
jgi:CheY-like chemotaxis protein